MARIETDPFYTAPTFPRATASTDLFKKEDVQQLAAAMSTHDHTTGKGAVLVAGSIPAGSITSAMIADGTIVAGDIANGAITTDKILDGTIATADHADASVTNAKLASDTARANLLTNGGFEIWQRGTGAFTTNGSYAADRWTLAPSGTDTMSVSRDTANKDANGQACAAVTFTLGSGAGGSTVREQLVMADYGFPLSGTWSFSIRVKTSAANAVRAWYHSGAAAFAGTAHSGSGVYETLTVTAALPASGTTIYFGVSFAASCTAYIDNAMLVVGAVPADYAPLHPADDLARCLRYYEVISAANGQYIGSGQAFSTTQALHTTYSKVSKAATPTVTYSAAGTFTTTNAAAANAACTVVATASNSPQGPVGIVVTVASGLVAGNASILSSASSQTATVTLESNP